MLAEADVVIGGNRFEVPPGGRLQLYQIAFTGYDWITAADLPKGVVFCNTYEHETTIAEHVLLGMREFQIGLRRDTDALTRATAYNCRRTPAGPTPPDRTRGGEGKGVA